MSVDYETRRENVLKFRQLLPGIMRAAARAPALRRIVKELLSQKMTDNLTVGTWIEDNAKKYPGRPAIMYKDITLTHDEFNREANRLANHFVQRGLKKGDVAVVMLDSRPELLMLVVAMAKLGAVASLINVNQRGKVLAHSIEESKGRLFIVGREMADAFEEIRSGLDLAGGDEVYFVADDTGESAPEGYKDLKALAAGAGDENPPTTRQCTMADPFAYVFTSGTTGLPKASIILNFRWVGAARWFGKLAMDLKPEDVMYVTLPFFHTNGLLVAWGAAAANGSAMAIRRKFSASNFWADTRKYNATSFIYIGEVCRYLMNQPPKPEDRDNPVRKIVGNGLRPEIWREFKKRFGIKYVYELYGAAEGAMVFTNLLNLDYTVGVCATPNAIVRYDVDADRPVLGEDGFMQKVGRGEVGLLLGEITPRSPFAGYTNKEATEKKVFKNVFREGDAWFNTGDLLRNIGFGHAQFVDRLGDTFRWKGENVSTTEVEEVVNAFPGVAGSTVYGVSVPGTDGRAGMVSVVTETLQDNLDKESLARALKSSLPPYAVPIFLRVKTEFDTTHTHKIKKTDLKRQGFDPAEIKDPLYVLLPGSDRYQPLTREVHEEIVSGKYKL